MASKSNASTEARDHAWIDAKREVASLIAQLDDARRHGEPVDELKGRLAAAVRRERDLEVM